MEIITKRCPYCREEIQADALKCKHCGEYLTSVPQQPENKCNDKKLPPPNNYLVWAILVTIFCCIPFGVVSIVYAAKVDSTYARGEIDEAYRVSRQARNWVNASWITGLSLVIIYYVVVVAILGAGFFASELFY